MADYQKVEFKSEPSSADNPEQTPALETTEAPPQQEFPVETPQEPVVERPEWGRIVFYCFTKCYR